MGLFDFVTAFLLGLATPLTAVCVLPLYPAFLSFLAGQFSKKTTKGQYALLGLTITLGVIIFMLLLGVLFTTILQQSLTNVIGIVSPIAFGMLGVISLLLIFNFDFSKFLPKIRVPISKNPLKSALIFGFFFGAIIIPCNPGFIATFFARAFLINDFVGSMLNFLFFGIGLGAPLLVLSLISAQWSGTVIGFLTRHKRAINLITGLIMLGIALYYLSCVFGVLPLGNVCQSLGLG